MKKMMQMIRWCLCLALAVSLFVIGRQAYDSWKNQRASDEAARIAGLTADRREAAGPETETGAAEPIPEAVIDLADIDLEALREINEDVAGWIAVPGTEISYPLMQGEDNRYYLSHTWNEESSKSGSVFLESANSRDLTDFHTIVYGHRMRNNTMFGSLKYYRELDYWRDHPDVYVVLENGRVLRYEVFAAHEAGVRGVVYRLDIGEAELEEEFLQACLEGSAIDTGIVPETGDRILSLSTCTGTGYSRRWVVHTVFRAEYRLE